MIHVFFLDKNFAIQEVVLTIEYVKYPHTAQNISDALLVILDQWELREKVYIITTDNGANMKKAIKDMNEVSPNIKWQLYVVISYWKRTKPNQITSFKG